MRCELEVASFSFPPCVSDLVSMVSGMVPIALASLCTAKLQHNSSTSF